MPRTKLGMSAASIPFVLLLSGCLHNTGLPPSAISPSLTLRPVDRITAVAERRHRLPARRVILGNCQSGEIGPGVSRRGLRPPHDPDRRDRGLVGFHNDTWNRSIGGRERCEEGDSFVYETLVLFDMAAIPDASRVQEATLLIEAWRLEPCVSPITNRRLGVRDTFGIRGVVPRDSAWPSGTVRANALTNIPEGAKEVNRVGTSHLLFVDVTDWIRRWRASDTSNQGLSIFGMVGHNLERDDFKCVGEVRDVYIALRFN
jgi:hypothetical protein